MPSPALTILSGTSSSVVVGRARGQMRLCYCRGNSSPGLSGGQRPVVGEEEWVDQQPKEGRSPPSHGGDGAPAFSVLRGRLIRLFSEF